MVKAIPIILVTAVIILAVAGIGVVYYTGGFEQAGISGFSTLSLQEADLESDSPYFTGKTWIMTVRQGGLAQKATGSFDPDDIQDETSDDTTTKEDLEITIDYEDQECVYPVQKAGDDRPVYKLGVFEYIYVPIKDPCTMEEFRSRDSSKANKALVVNGRYFKGLVPYCYNIYWTEKTEVGIYGQTDLRSQFEITVEAGDDIDSAEFDTEGSTQGKIGDFAYAVWQGNLDTGKSCSYTTDMPFKPAFREGSWIVIDKSDYNSYDSSFESAISTFTQEPSREKTFTAVDTVNDRASSALVSEAFGSYSNPTSFTKAVLRETIQSPLQYPVITLYIKASSLGIYTPTPEVKLSSADSDCFGTGEEGVIKVDAKNIGEDYGVWNFYGSCDSGFDVTRSQEIGIRPGETRTITIPLSGTTGESKKTGKCTVFAENPAGVEEIDVGVCVTPQTSCNAGDLECGFSGGAHVIKECNSAGTGFKIIETCESGLVCEVGAFGKPKCVKAGQSQSIFDIIADFLGLKDLWELVNNFVIKFRLVFSILAGFVAGLLSILLYRRFEELSDLKSKPYVKFIVGAVFALAIGFLAYTYFWIVVIGLVVLLILKIVL